jgi:GT2 family glycosyltransferase
MRGFAALQPWQYIYKLIGALELDRMIPDSYQTVAIVAIGRNEGDRLKGCLRAAMASARTVVYVDSGSEDGSAEYAASVGCIVVRLDPSQPFSAARARNEGFARAMEQNPDVDFVQFVDGDCDLVDGWLKRGVAALNERQDAGIVWGHVREIHPEASVYNRLCDLEWRQQPGEVDACGGIFMMRAKTFCAVGGFRADVIAGEEPEFCVRVRRLGWRILLRDVPMTRHDMAMTRFGEWWRRTRRTGHAYAQVAALHGENGERRNVRDCRKVWLWALALPASALCLAPFTYGLSLVAMLALYAFQFCHIYLGGKKRGWGSGDALTYAWFTVIAKFPMLAGMLTYHWRKMRGRAMTIIEYRGIKRSQ